MGAVGVCPGPWALQGLQVGSGAAEGGGSRRLPHSCTFPPSPGPGCSWEEAPGPGHRTLRHTLSPSPVSPRFVDEDAEAFDDLLEVALARHVGGLHSQRVRSDGPPEPAQDPARCPRSSSPNARCPRRTPPGHRCLQSRLLPTAQRPAPSRRPARP